MGMGIILGGILTGAVAAALLGEWFGASQEVRLILWGTCGVLLVALLGRAFSMVSSLPRTKATRALRLHLMLHAVPLVYFPAAAVVSPGPQLGLVFIAPTLAFFLTGTRAWKICGSNLKSKIYKLFAIGNRQMSIIFPVLLLIDLIGWPFEGGASFSGMMRGYFAVHFLITGLTVAILERDLRREAEQVTEP